MGGKRCVGDEERLDRKRAAVARAKAKRKANGKYQENNRRINAINNRLHDGAYLASFKDEGDGLNLTTGDLRTYFNLGSGCRQHRPARRHA